MDKPLADWSRDMNQMTGTDMTLPGESDNWLRSASVSLDRLLEKTGIPAVTEEIGGAVGGLVGREEYGRHLGHGASGWP